jgi:hypothetical protein
MKRHYLILIIALTTWRLQAQDQQTNSGHPTMQKLSALLKTKKADTIQVKVAFPSETIPLRDTIISLFAYTDTIQLKNGFYSIGLLTIDPFNEFNFLQINKWTMFYPNGKAFSTGNYQLGAYVICSGQAPTRRGYSYRTDKWTFWYENSKVMAHGYFDEKKTIQKENTGNQVILTSEIGGKLIFYNDKGQIIKANKTLTDKINNGI